MRQISIEFFHDTICSFCFPMSNRMRQLQQEMPEVEIIHRSFALVKDPKDFQIMFGSREVAKEKILSHWYQANQNDDLNRFNVEGMQRTTFPFPASMQALLATKAAFFIGGDALYWDLFDALQKKLFMYSQNIDDLVVIEDAVQSVGIDVEIWRKHFTAPQTKEAVNNDLKLAARYQINSVPSLVIDGKYTISGAQSLEAIKSVIKEIQLQQNIEDHQEGNSCNFTDGKLICD